MRWHGTIVLGSLLFMLTASGEAQEIHVTSLEKSKTLGTFERAEWTIDIGQTYHNPFDPAEIAVDAIFTAPSGKKLTAPAFWNAPEDGSAAPSFMVRFAPSEPGNWSFEVVAVDKSGRRTSSGSTFQVTSSQHRGFIRRASNNRYLRFDSGDSYFPVGINLCWANGKVPLQWYEDSFKTLSTNRVNYIRVWMCHPEAMLESAKSGLGRFDQANAIFFDKLLASAQEQNIGVMLCFMNHRELIDRDMWGAAGWPTFPYNAKNGGPATQPVDFFINADARHAFKARLRYITARYSAYTSVAFWELFNEQELAHVQIPTSWNGEMTAYLRQVDPVKHLITTSANVSPAVWELPDIDMTQSHLYGDGSEADMTMEVASSAIQNQWFNKPHLIGEMGLDFKGPDLKFDPAGKGTAFHNGIWAGMLSGNAGSGIYWWWDNYVGSKSLWHEFKPAAAFAAPIDWAGKNFQPIIITELWHGDATTPPADLSLQPSGSWGATAKEPITIAANGRPSGFIPIYQCGPKHGNLHSPLTIEIDLPVDAELILDVAKASDYAVMRVSVDDKPIQDLEFSALPGSPTIEKTRWSEENQIYQGDVNKKFRMLVPAGHHRVKLDSVAGDWITLSQITFTHAVPAKYADLAGFALQDAPSHETLVWILNTRSSWKEDQLHDAPPPQAAVQLTVPNIDSGSYTAQWWNTRTGQIISTDFATADGGHLTLKVPVFNRDIALRLQQHDGKP